MGPIAWWKHWIGGRWGAAHLAGDPGERQGGAADAAGVHTRRPWAGPRFEGVPADAAHYLREAENEFRRIVATGHPVPDGLRQEIDRLLQEIEAGVQSTRPPQTQVMWRSLSELEQLVMWATPDAELPL